jgi:hypothetical protein
MLINFIMAGKIQAAAAWYRAVGPHDRLLRLDAMSTAASNPFRSMIPLAKNPDAWASIGRMM